MGFTKDATGRPVYNNDIADPVGQLQASADFAALVGNRRKGTRAERLAVSGYPGVEWEETDTLFTYKYFGTPIGNWVRVDGGHTLSKYGVWTPVASAFPVIKTGVAAGDTSPAGLLQHTFPVPFPSECSMVIPATNTNSGAAAGSPPLVVDGSVSRTGFITFWAGRASSPVGVPYLAVGY